MTKLTRLSLAALLSFSPLALMAQSHDTHAAPAAEKHEVPAAAAHETPPSEGHAAPEAGHDAHGAAAHDAAPGHEAAHEGAHHGPAMKLFGKEYGNGGAFLVQQALLLLAGGIRQGLAALEGLGTQVLQAGLVVLLPGVKQSSSLGLGIAARIQIPVAVVHDLGDGLEEHHPKVDVKHHEQHHHEQEGRQIGAHGIRHLGQDARDGAIPFG